MRRGCCRGLALACCAGACSALVGVRAPAGWSRNRVQLQGAAASRDAPSLRSRSVWLMRSTATTRRRKRQHLEFKSDVKPPTADEKTPRVENLIPRRPPLQLDPKLMPHADGHQDIEALAPLEVEGPDPSPGGGDGAPGLWQARLLLLLASALYGTNFASVKLLEESLEPSTAAALRFGIAALALAPALTRITGKALRDGLEIGLWVAMGYISQSIALTTTSASKSAFICSLAVVFVPILDSVFGNSSETAVEQASGGHAFGGGDGGGKWTAALLAAAGVACLELGGLEAPAIGDLWALAQPVCFGMGFWRMAKFARESPNHAMGLTAAQLLAVSGLSTLWAMLSGADFSVVPGVLAGDARVGVALLWTGLITTALTVGFETVALKRLSAAESTVIFSTEPLWGTAFAVALLGEHAGLHTAAGALLILCACLWSTMKRQLLGGAAAVGGLLGAPALLENAAVNAARLLEPLAELLGIDPLDIEL
ncbi:hypothetical protein JKP88DRAFT_266157 [Tribonema minus]|uniref:EamA domain-containing protein n=1 Tax=Tribonema minus TaxID=303371 RepID=A0A835ZPH7_9STRA|nr:hypothetical protein JKP88DRAFT_266157 [Tribonema minus]